MLKKRRKKKRKVTKKQLQALAAGRAKRKRNLKRRNSTSNIKTKKRRKTYRRRNSTTNMKSLTGGTGDVNPQLFSGDNIMAVANAQRTVAFITPISRLPKFGTRATVMEILKIYVYIAEEIMGVAVETIKECTVGFTTKDFATTPFNASEPTCFAYFVKDIIGAFTALGSYMCQVAEEPKVIDLTDGQGHGVLVATDYIYVSVNTGGYAAPGSAQFKILYRFKNVPLTEYIGIVQSQQ